MIFIRLKHINEPFTGEDNKKVREKLMIEEDAPIILKRIQLSLFFMDIFPGLMPAIHKIKDKYKYDDKDSDQLYVLHNNVRILQKQNRIKGWDKVKFENLSASEKKVFLDNVFERAVNSSLDSTGGNAIQKLKKRIERRGDQIRSPQRETAARDYVKNVAMVDEGNIDKFTNNLKKFAPSNTS